MSTLATTNPTTSSVNSAQQETSVEPEQQQETNPLDQLVSTLNHVFSREYLSRDPTFVSHLNATNNEFSVSIDVVADLPIVKPHLLPPSSAAGLGEVVEVEGDGAVLGAGVLVYREKVVENKDPTPAETEVTDVSVPCDVLVLPSVVAPEPEQPDLELLKVALKKCTNLIFDEEKLICRPTMKLVQRTTLILRDIPPDTTDEEVRAIFSGSSTFAAILDTHPEIGNNYFVTFSDEESTGTAWTYLRTPGVEFRGKTVSARIKSESLLKNSYYVDPAVIRYQQQQQDQQQADSYWDSRQGYNSGRGGRGGRYNNNNGRRGGSRGGSNNNGTTAGGTKEYVPGARKQYTGNNGRYTNNSNTNGASTYKRGSYVPSAKDGSNSNATTPPNPTPKTQNVNAPLNGTSHWPPLQDKTHSGYNKTFQKYSRQQIVNIISSLNSAAATTTSTALATAVAAATDATAMATPTTTEPAAEGTTPTSITATPTVVAAEPEWSISVSQIPGSIYSVQANTAMEILRPVQEGTHVEFSDSKRRRRPSKGLNSTERKKSVSEGKQPTAATAAVSATVTKQQPKATTSAAKPTPTVPVAITTPPPTSTPAPTAAPAGPAPVSSNTPTKALKGYADAAKASLPLTS